MAAKTIDDLTALVGTNVATGDEVPVWHVAGSETQKVLVEQILAMATRLAAASGGTITLTFAATGSGAGNDVVIKGSNAGSGATAGGDIVIEPGTKSGAGADGVMVVRQPGGTPGTDEGQLYHDGTFFVIKNPDHSGLGNIQINPEGTDGGGIFMGPAGSSSFIFLRNFESQFQVLTTAFGLAPVQAGSFRLGVDGDTCLQKITGLVASIQQINQSPAWFQDSAGSLMANTSPTNNTATLASTNLAWALIAGRSYSIKGKISGGNSTAAEGFKFALTADGTLTATTFDLSVVGTNGTVVAGTQRVTSLGTAVTFTTFTAPSDVSFVGEIKCGVSGVLTLQFAETSTAVGTATLNAGSWVELNDMRAV